MCFLDLPLKSWKNFYASHTTSLSVLIQRTCFFWSWKNSCLAYASPICAFLKDTHELWTNLVSHRRHQIFFFWIVHMLNGGRTDVRMSKLRKSSVYWTQTYLSSQINLWESTFIVTRTLKPISVQITNFRFAIITWIMIKCILPLCIGITWRLLIKGNIYLSKHRTSTWKL